MVRRCALLFVCLLSVFAIHLAAQQPDASFAPLENWKKAIESGDSAKLATFYSKEPSAVHKTETGDQPAAPSELKFWGDLRKSGLRDLQLELRKSEQKQGMQLVSFQASFTTNTPTGERKRYVLYQQAWQKQSDDWAIVLLAHSDILKIRQPRALNPKLYDPAMNAADEIRKELVDAAKTKRRLILVFGGNWCYDCHVLDGAFHEPDVAPIIEKNFIVVHVDIGDDGKKNNDLATKYKTPLDKGVPVLAVLDESGSVIYSQQNGEFESARSMDPDDLIAFLNTWKPNK